MALHGTDTDAVLFRLIAEECGFEVEVFSDVQDADVITTAMREKFIDTDVAVIYFTGHGETAETQSAIHGLMLIREADGCKHYLSADMINDTLKGIGFKGTCWYVLDMCEAGSNPMAYSFDKQSGGPFHAEDEDGDPLDDEMGVRLDAPFNDRRSHKYPGLVASYPNSETWNQEDGSYMTRALHSAVFYRGEGLNLDNLEIIIQDEMEILLRKLERTTYNPREPHVDRDNCAGSFLGIAQERPFPQVQEAELDLRNQRTVSDEQYVNWISNQLRQPK